MAEEEKRWRVRPEQVALKAAAAVVFALVALRGDAGFVLLGGIIALALTALAVRDILVPVRLAADQEGITVVTGIAGTRRIPWAEIKHIRLYKSRRLGLPSRLLEIDTGDSLHLLSTHDLGAPPEAVERELRTIRLGATGRPEDAAGRQGDAVQRPGDVIRRRGDVIRRPEDGETR
ncbi:PH domain-containing protein [Actinomadura alba]|uniref:PH domain-containing protein n=1 Tax=Actinomadura alba TaxID=406431 RepID=UPI0028A8DE04|nr:PH domain-containing protein [Actinomadura alba]